MSENKTQPTAASVPEFLAGVPDARRRDDAATVCALMEKVTGMEPVMWGPSIVGFGNHHYRYESGREGDTFVVGFSPRKAALTLYLTSGQPLDPAVLSRLGKHRLGKGCLYVNRLSDVDIDVLAELIRNAAQPPG